MENQEKWSKWFDGTMARRFFLYKEEGFLINKYIKRNHKVFDVGAGYGRVLYFLKNKGQDVKGIDLSYEDENIEKKDFLDFEAQEKFDVVLCLLNSLDYFSPYENRKKALVKMKSLLKEGGILILSSHYRLPFFNFKKSKYPGFYFEEVDGNYLLTFYGFGNTLKRELNSLNLKVIEYLPRRGGTKWLFGRLLRRANFVYAVAKKNG